VSKELQFERLFAVAGYDNARVTANIDCHSDDHWPAAHLAVFDVRLLGNGTIDDKLDLLPAIWAIHHFFLQFVRHGTARPD
jgi:hypothetical protein